MKFSLFEEEFKNEWEAKPVENALGVIASETKQSRESSDSNLGVRPLNKVPARISLLSHFSFTFLIIALVTGVLAGAGWYFRDSALASVVLNKYLDRQIESGLVGHWTFDGPDMNWSSTTAEVTDKSGNSNNGNLVGFSATAVAPGKMGQGLTFDGIDDSIVQYPSLIISNYPLTISVWFKTTHPGPGLRTMLSLSGISESIAILQFVDNGGECGGTGHIKYITRDNNSLYAMICSEENLNDGRWHLATGVSSSENDHRLFIDGVLQGIDTNSLDIPTFSALSAGSKGAVQFFPGLLDDVRIYNRALTQKEITRLYKLGEGTKINVSPNAVVDDGLVGHWTFDGPDITGTSTVLDRSSTHATGTMVNMATSSRVSGKHGQALQFDGVNDYVDAGSPTSLDDITTTTIVAWIKPRIVTGNIVSKFGVPLRGWGFGVSNVSKKIYVESFFTGTDGSWNGPYIRAGEWQHLSLVYDHSSATNVPIFYINGVATTTTVGAQPTGTYESDASDSLGIGMNPFFGTPFNGLIDDVRIYNRILSADEIAQLYHAGEGVKQGRCGTGNIRDADGNFYNVIEIGTQCWLDRNMNVGTRINAATAQTNNATTEKWCYSNTDSNCTDNHPKLPDGGLYQWDEAMQYSTTEGARGICPAGWHIPTDTEWYTLENFLKASTTATCNASRNGTFDCIGASTRLKSGGNSFFEANLSGASVSGSSLFRDTYGYFWSSTKNGTEVWRRLISSSDSTIAREDIILGISHSVRCIKDSN